MNTRATNTTGSRNRATADEAEGPPRGRGSKVGRPPRISRQAILIESMNLLENGSVEEFTLANVARRLGTVSMALYNYFPNREVLLDEVANEACKQFRMPEPVAGQDWKKTLSDWTWALYELGKRYPTLFNVSGIDGRTSAGWLAIAHVVGRTLHELGFRGKSLALTKWLFVCQVMNLVHIEVTNLGYHSPISLARVEELDPESQQFYLMVRPYYEKISSEDVLREGLVDQLAAVERRIPQQRRGR